VCAVCRSVDSLESGDSREASGEWVTVYDAESTAQQQTKSADDDVMVESTDSLEGVAGDGVGDEEAGGVAEVSGSASYESFEADSLQDDVDEEQTLVSSQSQDSLLVAGATAATSMDISFGSSGAWSQSTVWYLFVYQGQQNTT